MTLDLSSLKEAVTSLEKTLRAACSSEKMAALDKDQREAIKAGVIKNFEFTYEACWKFIQRWLRENRSGTEAADPRTRKDLFRAAARDGLIRDPLVWFEYGDARNLTSHAYDRAKAEIVFQAAVGFLPDAKYLLQQLQNRND
ncbi:MAG: nucleotidyltransferase substrate binding protein [Candidatus Omnitrophica bacterium]|nr:nucleotidyltransferase substrate binding protein [Candidatus Omnitrophota bacterium]